MSRAENDPAPPMTPPAGFADRVVDAWGAERHRRRRRRAVALAATAAIALGLGLGWRTSPAPVELGVRIDRPALPAGGGEATVMVTLRTTADETPPVALAAFTGASIAKAPWWSTTTRPSPASGCGTCAAR